MRLNRVIFAMALLLALGCDRDESDLRSGSAGADAAVEPSDAKHEGENGAFSVQQSPGDRDLRPPSDATCQAFIDRAYVLWERGQRECRVCADLQRSCLRCRLALRLPIDPPIVDEEQCRLTCDSVGVCQGRVDDITFDIRQIHAEYIAAGCRHPLYPYSLGGIPIYTVCDDLIPPEEPEPFPNPAPAPPPAPAPAPEPAPAPAPAPAE